MQKKIAIGLLIAGVAIAGPANAGIMFYLQNKAGGVIVLTDAENAKHCGSGPDNAWSPAFASNRDGKPVALGCWTVDENGDAKIRWFEGLTETRTYDLDAFETTPYGNKTLEDAAKKLGL